jgi:hypothetical protein
MFIRMVFTMLRTYNLPTLTGQKQIRRLDF